MKVEQEWFFFFNQGGEAIAITYRLISELKWKEMFENHEWAIYSRLVLLLKRGSGPASRFLSVRKIIYGC